MSRNGTCSACITGDHKRHEHVVRPAPEGGVGGVVCNCEGECMDPEVKRANQERLLGPAGAALAESLKDRSGTEQESSQ